MIGYEMLSIVIVVAAFFSGFYLCRLLDKRLLKDMQVETDALKERLHGAENLLSQRTIQNWPDTEPVTDTSDAKAEDAFEGKVAPRLDETQMSVKGSAELDTRFLGSDSGAPSAFRQKVRLTKVIGQENGVRLLRPILGIQETPPVVGESYRIIKEDGGTFYTSVVIKVSPGYIQTLNSVYRIEASEPDDSEDSGKAS